MTDKIPTHAIEFRNNEFRQVAYDQSGNGNHVYSEWRLGGDVLNQVFDALLKGSSISIADSRIVLNNPQNYILPHWRTNLG